MPLTINTNINALNANTNLNKTYGELTSSISKLSSGMRISKASDDPAGLATRELMRADIAVLNQGVRNTNDAVSLLQTMDGATAALNEKLIRMRELAEQAATDTYSQTQKKIMQLEFDKMRDEIDRIASSTQFNEIRMLNASSAATAQSIVIAGDANYNSASTVVTGLTNIGSGNTLTVMLADHDGTTYSKTITMTSSLTFTSLRDTLNTSFNSVSSGNAAFHFGNPTSSTTIAGRLMAVDNSSGKSSLDVKFLVGGQQKYDFDVFTEGLAGTVLIHFGLSDKEGDDYIRITKFDVSAAGLGIDSSTLSPIWQSLQNARTALTSINNAINRVDEARASFGAYMKSLESTSFHLSIQAQNLQGAEAQISDVDVASEMTRFTNNQIKAQAAIAMLAQANSIPQMALTLLNG